MKNKLSLAAFLAAAVACAVQALHYAPMLPDRVASHFGPGGAPNGWMSSSTFIWTDLGIVALLTVMLLSVSFRMRSIDPAEIKLPNKDYWLAPERREGSVDFLSGYFLWFGTATLLLMLDIFHQVFRYNLFQTRELEHPGVSLGVYMAFALAWIAGLQLRFRRK
ncbi:MAG TPA: DUF1648 domain-containing protein [Elusimicrobiota bacterium]|nr:DUF1648 domain-containing protein [Elusimicrobiota bacterium]